jgi:hypothetical protein
VRGYDVVHVHGAAGTILWPAAAVAACGLSGTPLVVTLHLPPVPALPTAGCPPYAARWSGCRASCCSVP